jgi:hypothetical protein
MKRRTRLQIVALEDRCLPSFSQAVGYAVGAGPYEVVTADFNGDGIPDLATANYSSNTVSVLLGKADGTFQPAKASATGANPLSLAVGDFNGDQILDLATANRDANSVSVLLGTGTGTFQAPTSVSISQPTSVAVGDFNGDGALDLGVMSAIPYEFDPDLGYSHTITANVLLGNGIGGFSSPNSTWLGDGYGISTSATTANLDGVGPDELVVANTDSGYYGVVAVLTGDASGFLQVTDVLDTGASAYGVAVGDVNADGALDIVTANWSYASVSVLLGDGLGGYGVAQTFAAGDYPHSLALGDFTGDGNVDIAVTDFYAGFVNLLHGVGDGAFAVPIPFAAGRNPASLASGDFDGDGWLDLATANYGGYSVSVLLNDGVWDGSQPPPSITVNDVTFSEGNTGTTNATFTVTLSAPSSQTVTVQYATGDGSATPGGDYQAVSGTLIFASGETSRTITVPVIGDRLVEPNETFFVNLSGATNATIADGQGAGTIVDDEPRIRISDVTKKEGNGKKTTLFTFTVTLSAAYDQPVTMSYAAVNGTATTSDGDYLTKTGTLTFAPGETTKTITIEVKGDSEKEANETFYLDLFGLSSNALFTKNRGIGTILNDD